MPFRTAHRGDLTPTVVEVVENMITPFHVVCVAC